jgi:hypothetical protein
MNLPPISLRTLGFCLLAWMLLGLVPDRICHYPTGVAAAAPVDDLQDRLVSGLQVRRPVDLAFIVRVVKLVEEDRLPLSLVLSTYKWAYPKTPRPYPYFEQALRVRAARIGVEL